MRRNVGWWCLFFDKDYKIQVAGSFGCSRKDFYRDVLKNYAPKLIITINRMRLGFMGRKVLREMSEILTKGESNK